MKRETLTKTAGRIKLYKFEYIRDIMIKNITCGDLKAYVKLPTISDVCHSYNLSEVTVRRAYMHLRKRGYIAYLPGLGYFVEDKVNNPEKKQTEFDKVDATLIGSRY